MSIANAVKTCGRCDSLLPNQEDEVDRRCCYANTKSLFAVVAAAKKQSRERGGRERALTQRWRNRVVLVAGSGEKKE